MSWGAVAGAAVGVAGGLVGSKMSANAAESAADAQAQANRERLEFEKARYEEWQNTYGSLEDNLAKYYETLTPTLRTMQGLQAFEKEKNTALKNLRENLAQRGIANSGIAAQTETSIALESAAERASIRAAAPMEAPREKASFLQIGLGQNPASSVGSALADRSSEAARVARDTAIASGTATQAAVESGANLASELVNVFFDEEK